MFSTDVARALVETNAIAPLKFMPNEDATFGFWVMGMNLRRVDHPRAKTAAGHCCYKCGHALSAVRCGVLLSASHIGERSFWQKQGILQREF